MLSKEAIEYLEQFIGIKKEYKYKPIKVKTMINTRKAIETVLQALENYKTHNDKYMNGELFSAKQMKFIEKEYIPKKKIEDYKNKFIKESKKEKVFMTQSSQINASLISFCEELLEDK